MSLTLRAARMRGEFLLAELARRGFAPSYGFPTDVVAFDHRAGLRGEEGDAAPAFGFRARGASRPLDIAIREYAPGAEVVIDGLVHMSEGVRPAWSAGTDASRLEDLGAFWRCERCGGAGMTSQSPETCPACGERVSHVRRTLRPAGFLGRRKPHSGYEMLAQTPYQRPEIVAAGADWQALPDPEAGRFRSAPEGHVHSLSSGAQGGGFAICLDCGRAEAMPPPDAAFATPLPEALRRHAPLAPVRNRTRDGLCPASDAPHRIQRHVHLAHDAMTDVFEFQAPHGVQPKPCLAFGAGLREALADMLGVEAREIGVTLADSRGPAGEARRSVCLFDRAPGGAGYATRLADGELFTAALRGALERLACPENCGTGCPACVLRPDLNQRDVEMDREGGRALAADLLRRIALPDALRVFGEGTAMLGRRLGDWLADEERSGRIADLTVFLQGSPKDWDFDGAGFAPIVRRLRDRARVAIPQPALTAAGWNHGVALALIGLGCEAARIAAAPDVGGLPLLAAVRRPDGTTVGVACSEAQDAAPGSDWGRGDRAPLLRGPLSAPPAMQAVPMANVARISAGDGWLLHAGASLDGPLAGFGARFWKRLSEAAPLPVAAMRATGIAELRYSDRYLLSPAALALFAETMRACPGLSGGAMTVDLAPGGGAGRPPRRLHHGYALDAERTAVLQALLPAASVRLHPEKADLDHFRAMHLRLRDGRTVMILLDQGFGAWRTIGPDRHDFGATAADQARALKRARVDIETSSASGSPIHLRFEEAPE